MAVAVSITIRPRRYEKNYFDIVAVWLKSLNTEYIIAEEKGNHLQIGTITDKRTNNIRRTIQRIMPFTPEDEAEKRYWLKISTHDDWKYLVGYCSKEGDRIEYNLDENIEVYNTYYNNKKDIINNNEWICTSLNALPWKAYEYFQEKYPDRCIRLYNMRSICIDMFRNGLIPFSLTRKIRKDDEIIWDALVNPKWDINEIYKNSYE